MKVLIADDSQLVREQLRGMLAKIPCVTSYSSAADGAEALTSIIEHKPDVVLLDIHMPRLNGMEILKEIRSRNIPAVVIILTNFNLPQYRDFCTRAGADFFLDKSKNIDQIQHILSGMDSRLQII